ncbi:hypothetical protein [Alloscardovia criceti]|uniref:hypothetical protein n=1 Tax=Alloscardovia criceti TaxID=356828 RepID=UPI0003803077|nr:hypothetical protein [Alloscardovia criceti]
MSQFSSFHALCVLEDKSLAQSPSLSPLPRVVTKNSARISASLCAVALGFSTFCLPAAQAASTYSQCDSAYFTAKTVAASAQLVNNSAFTRPTARFVADNWLNVALSCPSRFSEGIIRSALALHNSSLPSGEDSLQIVDNLAQITHSFETADAFPMSSDALQALAKSEDTIRFAYEVLATRDYTQSDLVDRAQYAAQSSEAFSTGARKATSGDFVDSRSRIYDASEIIRYSGTNQAVGIAMPLSASLELDAALAELQAIQSDAQFQTDYHQSSLNTSNAGNEETNSTDDAQSDALVTYTALLIREHLLRALSLGAPGDMSLYMH